jgi:hypothetical protein
MRSVHDPCGSAMTVGCVDRFGQAAFPALGVRSRCARIGPIAWDVRRMLYRLIAIAVALLCVFAGGQVAGQEAIGTVSRIQGEASGVHGGATRALGLNASVFLNEVVSTGAAARLEVTFKDSTRLTLGEKTKLTLDRFVFNPAARRGRIRFRVSGAFRFLSRPGVQTGAVRRQDDNAFCRHRRARDGILGRADRRSGTRRVLDRRCRARVEHSGRADPEPLRSRHQYRQVGRSARAGDLMAAGQGQPRTRDRDVPIGRDRGTPT